MLWIHLGSAVSPLLCHPSVIHLLPTEKIERTVQIEASTVEIEERGVKLRLTVVDTPGYGDAINSQDWCVYVPWRSREWTTWDMFPVQHALSSFPPVLNNSLSQVSSQTPYFLPLLPLHSLRLNFLKLCVCVCVFACVASSCQCCQCCFPVQDLFPVDGPSIALFTHILSYEGYQKKETTELRWNNRKKRPLCFFSTELVYCHLLWNY